MENNIGIASYQFLIEMETENHKINEMIMAPRFAKLLDESVDETDFAIHKSKTKEIISEFVNKSFENLLNVLDIMTENLNSISYNDRLSMICENKCKSLTTDDRDIVLKKCDMTDTLAGVKFDLIGDITNVSESLSKVLESSSGTKEEYRKTMKSFSQLVSECTDRLNKIDLDNLERTDVSVSEISDVLNKFKKTDSDKEKAKSTIDDLKNKVLKNKEDSEKKETKIKEAVYLGASYLIKANYKLDKINTVSHENTVEILTQFVNCETSELSQAHFEAAISSIIRPNFAELYDDEIEF